MFTIVSEKNIIINVIMISRLLYRDCWQAENAKITIGVLLDPGHHHLVAKFYDNDCKRMI